MLPWRDGLLEVKKLFAQSLEVQTASISGFRTKFAGGYFQRNMPLIEKFNRRVHWLVRLMIVASLALVFALYIYPRVINNGWAAFMKLKGRAPDCSWGQIAFYYDSPNELCRD